MITTNDFNLFIHAFKRVHQKNIKFKSNKGTKMKDEANNQF